MNEYYHFYYLLKDFGDFKKNTVFLHDVLNYTCYPIDKAGQEKVTKSMNEELLSTPLFKRIEFHNDVLYFVNKNGDILLRSKNPYLYGNTHIAYCVMDNLLCLRLKNHQNARLQ